MDLLVISGLSGGGKSTALHALEDVGMYCTDNVPVPLVPELVRMVRGTDATRTVAVGIDARDGQFLERFGQVHRELQQAGLSVEVVFIEASDATLVRRYSTTRRLHPMGQLPEGIGRERELLGPIREVASLTIDTTDLNARQLRQLVRDRYGGGGGLRVALVSFGFRSGVPADADVVLDTRFLANPFEVDKLRPLSGLHEPVARYVLEQPDAEELLQRAESLVRFLVPRVSAEGRSYLTVALGCTGGQHRSVALVEQLKERLCGEPKLSARLLVRHRDVGHGP
ncbi:RNase adapter RapZ [Paraliomyxa miuraensis]|uniref:RNase adapter RapZ n=1 Tax=Paraliomyxa miuraensis TaxID=376150 RepID=UPI002251AB56|nr:RNase adapter RapZ [Paraliomyxa miuraensis]MCX4245456.1 RNase adapter RapZ [Paraliomyxa miuraensis]